MAPFKLPRWDASQLHKANSESLKQVQPRAFAKAFLHDLTSSVEDGWMLKCYKDQAFLVRPRASEHSVADKKRHAIIQHGCSPLFVHLLFVLELSRVIGTIKETNLNRRDVVGCSAAVSACEFLNDMELTTCLSADRNRCAGWHLASF